MRTKILIAAGATAVVALAGAAVWAQVGFKSTVVLQATTTVIDQPIQYPLFRNQVTASVLEIAPGGETGRHMHPNPTFVYVLEGTLTVDFDGHGQRAYTPGQSYLEAINHWHNGLNRGATPLKLLVVFAGEEGKPNLVRP
ncbi:MAG: cupin domain-containing protein [Armatimonadota bacterium]